MNLADIRFFEKKFEKYLKIIFLKISKKKNFYEGYLVHV